MSDPAETDVALPVAPEESGMSEEVAGEEVDPAPESIDDGAELEGGGGEREGAGGESAAAQSESVVAEGEAESGEEDEQELLSAMTSKIHDIIHGVEDIDTLSVNKIKKLLAEEYGKERVRARKKFIKQSINDEMTQILQMAVEDGEVGEEGAVAEEEVAEPVRKKKKKKKKRRLKSLAENEDDGAASNDERLYGNDDEEEFTPRPKKKRKTKKKRKIAGMPKKGKTSYICFCSSPEVMKRISTEHPEAKSFEELARIKSAMWKELTDEEKARYQEMAAADKRRYEVEMEEFARENPEIMRELEQEKRAGKKRRSEAARAAARERQRAKTAARQERGNFSGDEDEFNEPERPKAYIDQVMDSLKTRRKAKSELKDDELMEMAKFFCTKMNVVSNEDEKLNESGSPAVGKLGMLNEVVAQLGKKGMSDKLVAAGVLVSVRKWLTRLPDGSLPNQKIRESLYECLDNMPIDEEALHKSEGLGKVVMDLWKVETQKNRTKLKNLIQKWMTPIMNLKVSYQSLGEIERERSREMIRRKQILSKKVVRQESRSFFSNRAAPTKQVFDYARRPARDAREREGGDAARIQPRQIRNYPEESRKHNLNKKLKTFGKKFKGSASMQLKSVKICGK